MAQALGGLGLSLRNANHLVCKMQLWQHQEQFCRELSVGLSRVRECKASRLHLLLFPKECAHFISFNGRWGGSSQLALWAAALIFLLSYQSPNENDTQINTAQRRLQYPQPPTASCSLNSELTQGRREKSQKTELHSTGTTSQSCCAALVKPWDVNMLWDAVHSIKTHFDLYGMVFLHKESPLQWLELWPVSFLSLQVAHLKIMTIQPSGVIGTWKDNGKEDSL